MPPKEPVAGGKIEEKSSVAKEGGRPPTVVNDAVSDAMGSFGKWQFWMCCLIFVSKFPIAWHQLSIIFLAPRTDFYCSSQPNPTKTFNNKCFSNCTSYEYDRSLFKETIITQWELVCGRTWLKNLTQTFYMFGILVGSMTFGQMSDRYGRRKPFIITVMMVLVFGLASTFSVNWLMFTVLRFFLAVANGGIMVVGFVLVMEIIGPKFREFIGIIYQIPMNVGHISLAAFGYFIREWDTFQMSVSVPSFFFICYFCLLPESPRWLLTHGKTEEAIKLITKAAKGNSKPTENIAADIQRYNEVPGRKVQQETVFALFRTPKLRIRTIAIVFNWFVCGLCFFGVSQYMGQITGNVFVNVAVSGCFQVLGAVTSIFTNRYLGRKLSVIGAHCVTGISCLLIIVIPPGVGHLVCGSVGLMGCQISFCTVYLYAGEIFPTVVRNAGVGLASVLARIGSMVAPFVATVAPDVPWFPPVIFGCAPLFGAAICLLLPDTRGQKLPDTLEEGEQ